MGEHPRDATGLGDLFAERATVDPSMVGDVEDVQQCSETPDFGTEGRGLVLVSAVDFHHFSAPMTAS
jgi:hypothetical protein